VASFSRVKNVLAPQAVAPHQSDRRASAVQSGGSWLPRWGLPLFVLLLAALLRLCCLDAVPPGVTHDEAAHLHDAQSIWQGARPLYLTSGYGREPLYDYVTAPLAGLLDTHIYAGRLSSALWGVALLALTYAVWRGPLGRTAALSTALLMAVSFWPLSTSRQALRSITMPVLFTAAMVLFWYGLYGKRRRIGPYIGAGLLLGLSLYTYMPARVAWLTPLLFWLSLALTDRPRFRTHGGAVLLMLAVAAAVAAPLLIYLLQHPGLEVRVAELAWPLQAAWAGDARPLLQRIQEAALMVSHRGDVHWMYNISGRPLLPPPLALLFYLGLVAALLRLRRPGPRLLLLWLLVGVSPALATGLESSSLRAIAAQPAVFGLCALPLTALHRWSQRRTRLPALLYLLPLLVSVLSLWTAADTVQAYFVTWASHRDVRVAYHIHLAAEAAYLDTQDGSDPVCISTFYPHRPHDPAAMEALRGQADPRLRWFDGRGALIVPPSATARLLLPSAIPLDPALDSLIGPHAVALAPIRLRPTDLVSEVAVLAWDASAARSAALEQAQGPVGFWRGDALPPNHAYEPLSLPVALGPNLALAGYRLSPPVLYSGAELALVTFWQVHGPEEEDLVLFTHLLDDDGHVVGQSDRLDAPAWNWRAGDLLAQVHHLTIPTDLPPDRYHLQVGAYHRADGARLPVLVAGQPVDDRVLLQPAEVEQP